VYEESGMYIMACSEMDGIDFTAYLIVRPWVWDWLCMHGSGHVGMSLMMNIRTLFSS